MERDMKELRDRLNQQAARRLREDQVHTHTHTHTHTHINMANDNISQSQLTLFVNCLRFQYDEQQPPTDYRKSGEQPGYRPSDLQPPNFSEPSRYPGAEPRRSHSGQQQLGHQHSGPQHLGHEEQPLRARPHSGQEHQQQLMLEPANLQSPNAPPIPPREPKNIGAAPLTTGGMGK